MAEAQAFNLPTVLHCHDYWALCARVQMIRPDGERCDHNMGSGCFLCIKEHALHHVLSAIIDDMGKAVSQGQLGFLWRPHGTYNAGTNTVGPLPEDQAYPPPCSMKQTGFAGLQCIGALQQVFRRLTL